MTLGKVGWEESGRRLHPRCAAHRGRKISAIPRQSPLSRECFVHAGRSPHAWWQRPAGNALPSEYLAYVACGGGAAPRRDPMAPRARLRQRVRASDGRGFECVKGAHRGGRAAPSMRDVQVSGGE